MKLGLLQCGAVPDALARAHGDYPQLYPALLGPGFEWTTYRVFEGEVPSDPHAQDGWLVSGSRHGAYEDHVWIPPLEDLIRAAHAPRVPLVGICFGHQIVAQALGGHVEKFGGGWAVGRRAYDWQGETVHLNAWHQDQVVRPPEGAVTILANDFTACAGFAMDRTLTIQPHPEFPNGYIADMIPQVGRGTVPDELLDAAAAQLDQAVDNAATGRRLAQFLRQDTP